MATRVLITGICGFAGSVLARRLRELRPGLEIVGIDNLSRRGSELNLALLRSSGVAVEVADVRESRVFERLGKVDWVIDAAANPSVLAGVVGGVGSRELLEHNLWGTVEMLEFCRQRQIPFSLLSTSRVYSLPPLASLPLVVSGCRFEIASESAQLAGLSKLGIREDFSTRPPVSLYGNSKLCSENLALEYGAAFDFPVWINRCGVLAGAGQFGKADQGIFSFWIHSWAAKRPLRYLGFGGLGHQVRDCLHPADLAQLLLAQFDHGAVGDQPQVINLAGGLASSRSLAELSQWCAEEFGPHEVAADLSERPFDLPWVVLDSGLAGEAWDWRPRQSVDSILQEIAAHARANPNWLERVG